MSKLKIDTTWTLFLDRDGVINQRIPGQYISTIENFIFTPNALDAIQFFSTHFQTIVVVTNQQGIGKGVMTEQDLNRVHNHMITEIEKMGGHIDKVYFCPLLAKDNPSCRKPNTGMGFQAKKDFPSINFKKSIMVGDSISDMNFGLNLGMKTVFINGKKEDEAASHRISVDLRIDKLVDLIDFLDFKI